ncbi:MAG: hemerythrin domain-containing protein [Parvularculaceae bacterium]
MRTIIDDLKKDHRRFERFLGWYEHEIAKLSGGGTPNYELLRLLSEYFSLFPDELHHKKEDMVYDVLAGYAAECCEAIHDLREEHVMISKLAGDFAREVEAVLNEQELPVALLIKSARDYVDAMWKHMREEEEVFFPQAIKRLKDEDWRHIHNRAADFFAEEMNVEKAKEIFRTEETLNDYAA